jgi:hypothetical protein
VSHTRRLLLSVPQASWTCTRTSHSLKIKSIINISLTTNTQCLDTEVIPRPLIDLAVGHLDLYLVSRGPLCLPHSLGPSRLARPHAHLFRGHPSPCHLHPHLHPLPLPCTPVALLCHARYGGRVQMSTLSPNRGQDHLMSSSPANMATKTKPASKAATAAAHAAAKQKSQMHRRSRTGLSAFFGYLLGLHGSVRFRFVCHTIPGHPS